MKILFISDSFVEQNPCGGAECADQVIIDILKSRYSLTQSLSTDCGEETLKQDYDKIIVSNFTGLTPQFKKSLASYNYSIIEHDFKMLIGRHPNFYEDLVAPKSHVINQDFYRNARNVIFQSQRHLEVATKNLPLGNALVCGNAWSDFDLDFLASLIDTPKLYDAAVLSHPYPNKNTAGALDFCKKKSLKYLEIPRCSYPEYIKMLASCKSLVFIPTIFETYSRVSAEARCLGLDLITNVYTSFNFEPIAHLKGLDLIKVLRQNSHNLISLLLNQ